MVETVKDIARTVLRDPNGGWSYTRVITAVLIVAFLIVSFYLVATKQTWGNYDSFSTFCGGGGVASQLANKFINSKYNKPDGGDRK